MIVKKLIITKLDWHIHTHQHYLDRDCEVISTRKKEEEERMKWKQGEEKFYF